MSEFVHDWSHYNRYVDALVGQVGRPQRRPVLAGVLENSWTIARAIGLTLLALSAALALVIWASRESKVVVPELKVQVEQPRSSSRWPRNSDVTAPVSKDAGRVVRNYVLFTERTVPGVGAVVTGWRFASEKDERPASQWCYLVPVQGGEVGVTPHIPLSRFSDPRVSATALAQHRLTPSNLSAARQACTWFGGIS